MGGFVRQGVGAPGCALLAVTRLASTYAVVLSVGCTTPEGDGCPPFASCYPEPDPAWSYRSIWSDSSGFLMVVRSDGALLVHEGDGLKEVSLDRRLSE